MFIQVKKFFFRLFALATFIILFSPMNYAQSVSINYITPGEAVDILLGNNNTVEISNISYLGSEFQLANFNESGNSGVSKGILLTTGNAIVATWGNDNSNHGNPCCYEYYINTGVNDEDLANLAGVNVKSAAVLEFDFVPYSDKISFEFIFASEEYPMFAHSQFNDVFGFFVTGPGIDENIAVVPGTSTPISVNTINHISNSNYYIANHDQDCYSPPNGFCTSPLFTYNGYTSVLTASIDNLICTETYHIKLAIANVGDGLRGSAVFIEAGSFKGLVAGPVIATPNIICENESVTLKCEGDPTNNYIWKDSAGAIIGYGQEVNVIATLSSSPYTVSVSNPSVANCNKVFTTNVEVHPKNNITPFCLGFNSLMEYDYYVSAGELFELEINSFDALNENVTLELLNLPSNLNAQILHNNVYANFYHDKVLIKGAIFDIGIYSFQIKLVDNNICNPKDTIYNFNIHVVCGSCIGDKYYQKRGAGNTPLPLLTEALNNIFAGQNVDPSKENGIVLISEGESVTFIAGNKIILKDGFEVQSGANFKALISSNECENQCDDCCLNEPLLSIYKSLIPNVFTPNNDGINDYWYIPDPDHEFCAFGIMGFHLTIYGRHGNIVHDLEVKSETCCSFKAPGPNNPIEHSSIWWDGKASGGVPVPDGEYNYVLSVNQCNNNFKEFSGIIKLMR